MRSLLNVLLLLPLLLPLLLTVSCLPADQLTSEGSGDDVMRSDAAHPGLLMSWSEEAPLGLKTLESEDGDDEGTAEKDELFSSLADLLKRVQALETKDSESEPDPGSEPGTERGPELEAEPELELEPELEPEPEPELEPELEPKLELEAEDETAEEPEEELGREEQQTDSELEQASEPESEEGAAAAHEEESTGQEHQEQEPDQQQEHQDQEPDQEPSGTEKPDLGTTVFPVQLLNVPVAPEPAVPEPAVSEPAVPRDTEAPVARDTEPVDEPLGQNEVPLPVPARQPVEEPLIIAETAACLGCVTPILQDGADLRRVANMAAKLLEEELEERYTFRVTEVYRASKQVVNGIKYFLTLEVASTSCERPLPPFTLCFVASDTPRLLYAVEILHQPHRANTELLSHRKMDDSEIARSSGLFAAASPADEAPHHQTAPIASSDSLLDILMGLDSVNNKQRDRQSVAHTDAPGQPPLQADISGPPPLHMDMPGPPALQAERAGPPPLQADSALQASWQAELQQRHSSSQQAQQVQALLREAGWQQGPGAEQRGTELELELKTEAEEAEEAENEEELGCRNARQYDIQQVPLNVAHPRVQKILLKFLETQERAGSQRLVITDIQSATQQTIAETNYRFEIVLGASACPKNSTVNRYSCSATSTSPLSNCRVRARHRPGKPLQFNSISCTSKRQPQCANGRCQATEIHPYAPIYTQSPKVIVEVDIHDPTYQQLVQHVQNEVNRRSRRPLLKKYIKTLNATKVSYNLEETSEIIDQELYSLTLRFAETTCARTTELNSQEEGCLREWYPTAADSAAHPTSVCDVRVSSLGWADRMRVLDLFCETEVAPAAA